MKMVNAPINIMRIENQNHHHGMWYDARGNFDPIIQDISPDAKAVDLPMGFAEIHKAGGLDWHSAGDSIEQMNHWFSREDAELLHAEGFRLYKFTVNEWQRLEHEILFTRRGIIAQDEIDIDAVWTPTEVSK